MNPSAAAHTLEIRALDAKTFLCVEPRTPFLRRIAGIFRRGAAPQAGRNDLESLMFHLAYSHAPRWTGGRLLYEKIGVIMPCGHGQSLMPGIVVTLSTEENPDARALRWGAPQSFTPCCLHLFHVRQTKDGLESCIPRSDIVSPTPTEPCVSLHEILLTHGRIQDTPMAVPHADPGLRADFERLLRAERHG